MDVNIRERVCELGGEDAIIFDGPDFDPAIVGVTEDGRVVYDYNAMVKHMAETDGITYEEAMEFIEYNTIRACAYQENAPIIMYPIEK